jgi:nucleotide-binding universal stress UspA family protein
MKIVVGVDASKRAATIGGYISALRFADYELTLAHVLERIGEAGFSPEGGVPRDLIERFLKMQEDEANGILQSEHAELKKAGLESSKKLLTGFSGNRIVAYAEETKADVLAIGSSGKGTLEGAIIGSVGRKALISSSCSVLIAKRPVQSQGPLTVVFATDHSDYANRCIDRFIGWRPKGVGRAIVTTIYPEQFVQAMTSVMDNFKADVSSWVRTEFERNNQKVLQRLAPLGAACKSRVESGNVGNVLENVMKEEKADLLVLGAQGHGFMQRLMLGSVSLDQALKRPYSVLVMRV